MYLTMLKGKLHRATVTHAELDYDGSIAIDDELIELAGLREFEQVQVYNITNGERFVTYVIRAQAGSRIISLNGAAARKALPGDQVIIAAYATMDAAEASTFSPDLVYLGAGNRVERVGNATPVQVA